MRTTIIFLFISFFFSMQIKAQKMEHNKLEFPTSFILGKQDFLKSQIFISKETFLENGYSISNPGKTNEKEKIALFAEGFNTYDINQIYYEIYANKLSETQESFYIVVLEFNSKEKLNINMRIVDEAGLYYPSYSTTDKYLIIIGCEDRNLLENLSNFYTEKVGAQYYYPKKEQ